jgi:hypothetical protein
MLSPYLIRASSFALSVVATLVKSNVFGQH